MPSAHSSGGIDMEEFLLVMAKNIRYLKTLKNTTVWSNMSRNQINIVNFFLKLVHMTLKREGEEKEELSETFAVLDKDQDTFISREGQKYSARYY